MLLHFHSFPSQKLSLNQYDTALRKMHYLSLLVKWRLSTTFHYKANYRHGQRWGEGREKEEKMRQSQISIFFHRTQLSFSLLKSDKQAKPLCLLSFESLKRKPTFM